METTYGVYIINNERTRGSTTFYEDEMQANWICNEVLPGWWGYVLEQTWELEYDD